MQAANAGRRLALTLAMGAVGVLLSRLVYIPGGAFTAAMAVTALARLLGAPLAEPPRSLRHGARVVLGLTVGATVTAATLATVARALLPVALMVVSMVLLSLGAAWAINRLTRMPLPTAMCGSSPGVLAAMVALAEDLGGDPAVVASMHLVRLVSVLLFMPAFVAGALVQVAGDAPGAVAAPPPDLSGALLGALVPQPAALVARLVVLLGVGLGAGYVAVRIRVPAGELLAAMAAAALLCPVLLHGEALPATWRLFAQWVIGAGVGASVTREALRGFRPYALAGGALTAFLIVTGLGMGWALAELTSVDLVTAMMGSSPGGADTMIILAGELGADQQVVTAMHVSRQVLILVLVPVLTRTVLGARRTSLAGVRGARATRAETGASTGAGG